MLVALCVTGTALWLLHSEAWDLGRRSPVLNFDSAQYAVAARELAQHGRLATTFAVPLELARHGAPPWPLAVVQPGLVLAEAAILKLAPERLVIAGRNLANWQRPDEREWLLLALPFTCFLLIACVLGLAVVKLLRSHAPALDPWSVALAGLLCGLVFLLDPESQHFATGGFTEMPFTYGLVVAFAMLALGAPPKRPFLFGLVLGLAGLFRGNMLWLAPAFALAAAWLADPGRRARVFALSLAGYALVLAPWWLYKWREFGSPAWDLSTLALWEGVEGRNWFTLVHDTAMPGVPHGSEAARLLAEKFGRNARDLALMTLPGLRGVWLGALAVIAFMGAVPRRLRAVAMVALAAFALNLVVASLGVPHLRYLYPARIVADVAGALAALALAWRLPRLGFSPAATRTLLAAIVALTLLWGALQTARGNREAEVASRERGLPGTLSLLQLAVVMNREIPAGEPVMSNLGPNLAWHARRPVIHLALSPDDLAACRRLQNFDHVLLAFRDPSRAWPGWRDLVAQPLEAVHRPEWNVRHTRVFATSDGFTVIWLDLGPREPGLAAAYGTSTARLRHVPPPALTSTR